VTVCLSPVLCIVIVSRVRIAIKSLCEVGNQVLKTICVILIILLFTYLFTRIVLQNCDEENEDNLSSSCNDDLLDLSQTSDSSMEMEIIFLKRRKLNRILQFVEKIVLSCDDTQFK
jgi:hypothetical protein